jgi:integrase
MDLFKHLDKIIIANAGVRLNGKVAAHRTFTASKDVLHAGFRDLWELGYKLQDPTNLTDKHIKALCEFWIREGRKAATIRGNLCQFRKFARWIGKGGLVKPAEYYLPDVPKDRLKVSTVAKGSKSWAEHGIDVAAKIQEAEQIDWRFGLMLMAAVAFGLRRMELLQMQPWKNDKDKYFAVYYTKGGRPRNIDIDTPIQRQVLDLIKSKIKKNERLGWKERLDGSGPASLEYSEGRYNRLMEKIGISRTMADVTGHGLRAQFAENASLLKGLIPPTLGGNAGQMPKDDIDLKRLQVSELLGHSRISVTGAYYGSFRQVGEKLGFGIDIAVIKAAMAAIELDEAATIAEARLVDVMRLLNELVKVHIFGDVLRTHALWENYSRRYATEWLTPSEDSNLAALEAAAISVLRRGGRTALGDAQ